MTESGPTSLRTSWLGTASIWITCSETSLLIDGFFTRISLPRLLFSRLLSDPDQVERGLKRAGITRLDALLVTHTHYDHALDAPTIAHHSGAVLVGSASLAHLARGAGIPEKRIFLVESETRTTFGPLQVEWIASRHSRPDLASGNIRSPLSAPAHTIAYRSGKSFALLVQSPTGRLGILGSAGWVPGMFSGRTVDSLMISVAGLSRISKSEIEDFFDTTVLSTHAKIIYPIHWDDFFRPLAETPSFLPRYMDNIRATLSRIEALCHAHSVQFKLPPFFQPFDPFSDVK